MQWPSYHPELLTRQAPENNMIEVAGREVTIGKPLDWPSFGWDNEYGHRVFSATTFRASKCLVSNHEMLQFVKDGGYLDSSLWTSDGWKWCASTPEANFCPMYPMYPIVGQTLVFLGFW